MKAALYARVSTANNGQDPEVQLRELREYVQRRGWELAADCVYVDIGISGSKEKRPSLDRLMSDAHRRNPSFRSAFAFAHTGFGWLLGKRLVREHADPHAPTTFNMAR